MSAALNSSTTIAKRLTPREPDALAARDVDYLVSKLLGEIKVPFGSLGTRVLTQLADLKRILSTEYMDVPALPQKPLLKELAGVVEKDIKQHIPTYGSLTDLGSPQLLGHLSKLFGPRELELRAEPYRTGAGLSLRGFYCRADVGKKSKFVIFVNTAHHPGAVGATLGHELGHFIYGSLVGEKAAHTAFMEGAFANHLVEEDELFADSLVALAAYSPDLIKKIGGFAHLKRGSSDDMFNGIKYAYDLIGPRHGLDLTKSKMAAAWRVRYLTSMAHFFKLRCALYKSAGV
ncbi:MAG TPA: hypothetical protein VN865_03955 [Candidatus Acidoferrales bacterium]|jgi:hypothetical protein|nr:hypothetical protein [Candidatus Acidoferrales bacterium]